MASNSILNPERHPLSGIPSTFRAFVADRFDDRVERGVRDFAARDLSPGDVEIRIA